MYICENSMCTQKKEKNAMVTRGIENSTGRVIEMKMFCLY